MKTLTLICLSLLLQSYAAGYNTNPDKDDVLFKTDIDSFNKELNTMVSIDRHISMGSEISSSHYYKNFYELISPEDSLGFYSYFLIKKGVVNKKFKYYILQKVGASGGYENYVYLIVKDRNNKFLDKQLIAQLLADCGGESSTYGVLKNDLSAELIDYSIERECIADSVIREGIDSKYKIVFDTITKKFARK